MITCYNTFYEQAIRLLKSSMTCYIQSYAINALTMIWVQVRKNKMPVFFSTVSSLHITQYVQHSRAKRLPQMKLERSMVNLESQHVLSHCLCIYLLQSDDCRFQNCMRTSFGPLESFVYGRKTRNGSYQPNLRVRFHPKHCAVSRLVSYTPSGACFL